ncbi:MAG: zf-HC2 domain-containing protein [Terriglobales bacterium]
MTCSDVQRVLPEVLDGGLNGAFGSEFETHLRSCPDCSDLLSDLEMIATEARQLAATDEPSPRVWLRIAAHLRSEGLIRDQDSESTAGRPVLLSPSPRRRWSAWWLAPVAAALVAAGSYVISHKPAPQLAKQQVPATPEASPTQVPTSVPESPAATRANQPTATLEQEAKKSTPTNLAAPASKSTVEPLPSAEDQQFLSVVSTRAPSMRATYENQLNAVNSDIRETQAYVNRNPGDTDARQHLMDAYQQKTLLYQIALDRIQ